MSQCLEPSEYKVVSHLYDNGDSWEKCAAGARIFQKLKSAAWNSEVAPVSDYRIQVQENLPALAWICEIKNGSHVFTIGPRVEHGKDFIVEGAWDGDFQKGDFASSDHFYGSGAILEPENCIFVPPRLCTDYLFALHDADRATTWVSNSFNFLLARADINQNSVFYRTFAANLNKSTNEESALGADRGSPLIARSGSLSIYRFMYHNFSIDGEGNIQYLMRLPANPCIKDFLSYKNFLNDKVSLLLTRTCSHEIV